MEILKDNPKGRNEDLSLIEKSYAKLFKNWLKLNLLVL